MKPIKPLGKLDVSGSENRDQPAGEFPWKRAERIIFMKFDQILVETPVGMNVIFKFWKPIIPLGLLDISGSENRDQPAGEFPWEKDVRITFIMQNN